jgi:hypothetical protein
MTMLHPHRHTATKERYSTRYWSEAGKDWTGELGERVEVQTVNNNSDQIEGSSGKSEDGPGAQNASAIIGGHKSKDRHGCLMILPTAQCQIIRMIWDFQIHSVSFIFGTSSDIPITLLVRNRGSSDLRSKFAGTDTHFPIFRHSGLS